uniref:Uncharacterized protein n=1 Tax=Oryza brachyantha TaxID=4533 RepID=J3LEF4_ORYBR
PPGNDGGTGACTYTCTHRRGLLQLTRHVAGGCPHCRRFFQLLRLHSSVCARPDGDSCGVPLCSNFKATMEEDKVDKTWKLLVKVTRAWASRQRPAPLIVQKSWARYSSSNRSRAAARFR